MGINTSTPNAALDIVSTDKGILIPRVADPTTAITSPDESELVYDTTKKCYRYYTSGAWSGCISSSTITPSGDNADIVSFAFIGNYVDQATNGLKVGDYSFRIKRRPGTSGTTADQMDSQIKYSGALSSINLAGYAYTFWQGGQYDYAGSNSFLAPTATPETSTARSTGTLNQNVWTAIGEPGFQITPQEKRQYTITPISPTEKYFYRVEWGWFDGTATTCSGCPVGSPSENDGKVLIFVEFIKAR